MTKFTPLLLIFLYLFSSPFSCTQEEWRDGHIIDEKEPNDQQHLANEISVGNVYRGRIGEPVSGVPDRDLFKIWKPSGSIIVFEFESEDENFRPYVGHATGSGQNEFVLFKTPGRYVAEFPAAVTGWHYFEIGDKRNVFEEEEKVGGFVYYFRVNSYHICEDDKHPVLKPGKSFKSGFSDSYGNIETVVIRNENDGFHQINLNSTKSLSSDKFMFVYDCDGRQTVIGSDDEDYHSGKLDPLIYGRFQKDSNTILVIGRILADLTVGGTDTFEVTFTEHLPDRELEPNNLYKYANRTGYGPVSGELDSESILINGIRSDDVDIFKYPFQKGQLFNFSIETGNEKEFSAQIWAGSHSMTGAMIIPLRFSQLSGEHLHHINMYMPFTGSAYLYLEGRGIPYNFSVEKTADIHYLLQFDNKVLEWLEPQECKWIFRRWKMPEDGDFFEIKLSGVTNTAGFHIFSSDGLPFAFVPPSKDNRFYVYRYEKTEELLFGFYLSTCDQKSENLMNLRISEIEQNFVEWTNGFETTPVPVHKDGSYQGLIDTDNFFVENNFTITAWESGILHLTTAPDINSLDYFHINTVVTLKYNDLEMKKNNNMIEFLSYNKYSHLTFPVKKGVVYDVQVKPFMSESSHIPSMNIVGNYILDIRIK